MVCFSDIVAFAQKAFFASCFLAVFSGSTLQAQQLGRPVVPTLVARVAVAPLSVAQRRSANQATGDWYPYVIAREQDRTWIRDLPVEARPSRPMHFWGNSRRRSR